MKEQTRTQDTPVMRQLLRAATGEIHDKIEALWAPDNRFGSFERYRAFLTVLLDVHHRVGMAAALARQDPTEVGCERERIAALSADLGVSLPVNSNPVAMKNGYAWGVGYVLNGSTIGAKMILQDSYVGKDWPVRYLSLGRDYVRTGKLQNYFRSLEAAQGETADVVQGALDTFELFERYEAAA